MRSPALFAVSLLIVGHLGLAATTSFAQQAPATTTASPSRMGYYTRLQSQAGAQASAPASGRFRSRFDATSSLASRRSADENPLRPYGSDSPSASGTVPRPYERAPAVSPPQRDTPAPAVSHNYFPGGRPGQFSNGNMVPHCVPGRHSFSHR